MVYPFKKRGPDLSKIDAKISISKTTTWGELGLSPPQQNVFISQLLNLPLSEAESWSESDPIEAILDRYGLNQSKIIPLLNRAYNCLSSVYSGFAEVGEQMYFYKTQPLPPAAAKSEKWQYHHSLPTLDGVDMVVFCDLDEAWNLSAALSIKSNTKKEARVWEWDS
jgi:hypothetical protein